MKYYDRIIELTRKVPAELVDFSTERDHSRTPTQASSNFITNREQGDWAEKLITRAFNDASMNHVCVKYGKSDNLVAGDIGFDDFYQQFQYELDTIGKRPDLLIFHKNDFDRTLGYDISQFPHEKVTDYVKKAIAGIEVRSSAFLIDKYEEAMHQRTQDYIQKALDLKTLILNNYSSLLSVPQRSKYLLLLKSIDEETLSITDFKVPGWSSSSELVQLNSMFKELKKHLKEIQKRDFLSITPKVEDIKVVFKWIETFNIPHFYFQVFFDKVYGISFEQILTLISDSNNEGVVFSVESDTKNQNKTTIKINSRSGTPIAYKIDEPSHKSVRKEMNRGRLLFYVAFKGGTAYLDIDNLCNLLYINKDFF